MVHYFNGNCELCNSLKNTLYSVGVTFKNEPKCLIGRLNCDAEPQICIEQGIPHYPTLKVYSQHNKDGVIYQPGTNQESYSEKNITSFMNALCGTQRILRGRLNEKVRFVITTLRSSVTVSLCNCIEKLVFTHVNLRSFAESNFFLNQKRTFAAFPCSSSNRIS